MVCRDFSIQIGRRIVKLAHLIAINYMASWLESLDQIVNLWTILTTYDDHYHH